MFIDATAEAKQRSITLRKGQTIQVRGSLGSDVIPIEIPDGSGGWKSLTEGGEDDSPEVQLSEKREQLTAYGNTLVRINKPITSNSVGIAII